jgi:prepilin-type N-terminal cleavage/methylation domain-containing protein
VRGCVESERPTDGSFETMLQLVRPLYPCPLSRMRERVAGAVVAPGLRDNCDRRVRAGGRPRPTVVECCDSSLLAPSNLGGHNTPLPRAQRALSSGWHASRGMKSDQRAIHLLSPDERRESAGFTLIELAVVMFLMGLMLLIAMPYIGGVTDGQLKSVSRRLAGRATYLYDEASARKLVIQLVFDMDHNGYFVMVADPYSPRPTFFPDNSPSGARVLLPDAVHIRDVTVEGIGTLSRGTLATQFYPEGYVDATLVHLIDKKGRVMTLRIDPLTGQVGIARGDLRPTGGRSR